LTDELSIYSYTNCIRGHRPRQPLVQILACEDGDVQSIRFQPRDAEKIIQAIQKAAHAAELGHKRKRITIKLRQYKDD
jgi:hypothetical protein